MNECVDSDGNYVRINEGTPSSTKTGFTVQDGVTRGPGEPSIHSIAQVSEESNTSDKNNPDTVKKQLRQNRMLPMRLPYAIIKMPYIAQ